MNKSSLAGRSVLIVEDDYLLAAAFAEELSDHGATVIGPAPSIELALKLISEGEHLDVALLDGNIRGEAFYPIADALAIRGVPFVLVTGYDRHTMPERYQQGPILEKPVGTDVVIAALCRLQA